MTVTGKLSRARETVSVLSRYTSPRRAYNILKLVTMYHRIQGSPGLRDAVEAIEEYVLDHTPEPAEAESFAYTPRAAPEWLALPVEWQVHDAIVETPGRRYTLDKHPTLAVAHTPPSEGWIEGRVAVPPDPLDQSWYEENREAIPLITRYHRTAYKLAAEAGVPATVMAFPERDPRGTPYLGLFLTHEEAAKYSTVAVSLPWAEAKGLEGKTIRVNVDADIGGASRTPVLTAWIGDRSAPGPVIFAHICHPAPGANDNASGVAAAVEAFIALANAIDRGELAAPPSIRLVLAPEYTGSLLAMEGFMGKIGSVGINLDMVGRVGEHAGPQSIIYTPLVHGRSIVADALYDVSAVLGDPLPPRYYMAGSDHDVFLAYGRDSSMVNQWPDRFYHSDLDDADTISPGLLEKAALVAGAAAELLATGYEPTSLAAHRVREALVTGHIRGGDEEAARLAEYITGLRYGLGHGGPPEWVPIRDERRIEALVPMLAPPLTPPRGIDGELRILRAMEDAGLPREVYSREVFYAAKRAYTVARLHTESAAGHGSAKVTGEGLAKALESLEEAGLIRLTG